MRFKHPTDRLFKEGIEQYAPDAPLHLWDRIAGQLPEPELVLPVSANKRIWSGWLGLLLLLVFLNPVSEQSKTSRQVAFTPVSGMKGSQVNVPSIPPTPYTAPDVATNNEPLQSAMIPNVSLPTPEQKENRNGVSEMMDVSADDVTDFIEFETPRPADNRVQDRMPAVQSDQEKSAVALALLPTSFEVNRGLQQMAPPLRCASFKLAREGEFFMEWLGSSDLYWRTIEAKSKEFDGYARERDNSEKQTYSYSSAFHLGFRDQSGATIRAGVQLSRINERFDYEKESLVTLIITNRIGADGHIIGSDTIREVKAQMETIHNRIESIDIPVSVGYEHRIKKWSLGMQAGVLVNVGLKARGSFFAPPPADAPVAFSDNTPEGLDAFKNKVNTAYTAALSLGYRVAPKTEIRLEPHMQYRPDSYTNSTYVLDQRYTMVGLRLGIRQQL